MDITTSTFKPITHPLSDAIVKLAKPIFNCLAYESFLEGSNNVSNQNANESISNILWSFCPKERFNSLLSSSLAVSLTVCIYNSGLQRTLANLMKKCNLSFSKKSVEQRHRMDKERISKGDYAVREDRKKQRKLKKRSQVIQNDKFRKVSVCIINLKVSMQIPKTNEIVYNK